MRCLVSCFRLSFIVSPEILIDIWYHGEILFRKVWFWLSNFGKETNYQKKCLVLIRNMYTWTEFASPETIFEKNTHTKNGNDGLLLLNIPNIQYTIPKPFDVHIQYLRTAGSFASVFFMYYHSTLFCIKLQWLCTLSVYK